MKKGEEGAVIGLLVVFCLKDVPGSTTCGIPELLAIICIYSYLTDNFI